MNENFAAGADFTPWLAGGLGLGLCLAAVLYFYVSVCLTIMGRKTGTTHAWLAWIPGLNVFQMCRIGRCSLVWGFMAFVPGLGLIAFPVIWSAMAQARGKSGIAGLLIFVPVINLFVPLWLAMGPAIETEDALPSNLPPSPSRRVRQPAQSGSLGWLVALGGCGFLGLLVLGCGGLAAVFFWAPTSYTPSAKAAPHLPPRIAGTRQVFPIDTAPNPARPTNAVSQCFVPPRQDGKFTGPVMTPAEQLPSSLPPSTLPSVSTAITSATYRESAASPPVYVHAIDTTTQPNGANQLQQQIVQGGGSVTAQQVTSPLGSQFNGVRVENNGAVTHCLANTNATLVIILYAPEPAAFATVDRLAGNVGNGQGLDDPEFAGCTILLPGEPSPGLEMTCLATITGAEIQTGARQALLKGSQGEDEQAMAQMEQVLTQLQQVLPQNLLAAQFVDGSQRAWTLVVCDYGDVRRAWWLWQVLNWTLGSSLGKEQSVCGSEGCYIADPTGSCLLFQKGPYLIVLLAPADVTAESLTAWGDLLQP